jgi:hypothetical protein
MTLRNFNNVTTLGALTGPVSSSATTLSISNFTQYPAPPFTATIDRNTATEEIVLVTAIAGASATVSRGYDGTAPISHLAGATVEHTAVALDFSEANAHINATVNVHGTSGALVGATGAQTISGKTFTGNTHVADVTLGDAVVAQVPNGSGTRNLFRGVGTDGADKITVDSAGNITSAGVAVTTAIAGATSAATANKLVTRDGNGDAAFRKVSLSGTPSVSTDAATKSYVDTAVSATTATISAKADKTYVDSTDAARKAYVDALGTSAATAGAVVKRDGSARAQFGTPSAAADAATKGYVDGQFGDTGWVVTAAAAGWSGNILSRVKNGILYVTGLVQRTGANITPFSAVTIVQLPAGHKPGNNTFITGSSGGTFYGEVYCNNGGVVGLNGGISNGQTLPFLFTHPID